jgi:hypothetical protein
MLLLLDAGITLGVVAMAGCDRLAAAGAVPVTISWRVRIAVSSVSSFICSSAVKVVFGRGGGMSWTAGYAAGVAGRSGASAGRPPIALGMLSVRLLTDEDEQLASATASPQASNAPLNGRLAIK